MGVYVVSGPPAEFGCGVLVAGGQCRDAHSHLCCSSLGGPPDEESLRRRRHQSGRTSCKREKVPNINEKAYWIQSLLESQEELHDCQRLHMFTNDYNYCSRSWNTYELSSLFLQRQCVCMHMNVCMCVHVYVRICVHVSVCICIRECVSACMRASCMHVTCMHASTKSWLCVCVCVCVRAYMLACVFACYNMCECMHAYVRGCVCMRARMCVYIP